MRIERLLVVFVLPASPDLGIGRRAGLANLLSSSARKGGLVGLAASWTMCGSQEDGLLPDQVDPADELAYVR